MNLTLRGHIWTSRRFPDAAQRPAILAAGVSEARALYVNNIEAAITSLRKGNRLIVKDFRGLGRGRSEINENIKKVHAKGAAVIEAETGWTSTGKRRQDLVDEAVRRLGHKRRGPQKPTKRDRRMPWDAVLILYKDKRLNNEQFEDATRANGKYVKITYHTARRHFGEPRGVPTGRPSAARAALNATL